MTKLAAINLKLTDDMLMGPLYPPHTVEANTADTSPWSPLVSDYLGREVNMPAEGRPSGQGWAHQRYDEFQPVEAYATMQTGARTNTGFRDGVQHHGYEHYNYHLNFRYEYYYNDDFN